MMEQLSTSVEDAGDDGFGETRIDAGDKDLNADEGY